jgi:hypothetical protein
MNSDIYIDLEQNALFVGPGIFNDDSIHRINKRLTNYKDIANSHPEIDFYIYYLETLAYSEYHPLNKYFTNADQGQSFKYFEANLPSQIELGSMPIYGLEDHIDNFYRTDHHWNTNGIIKAYDGIYNMISSNQESISKQLSPIKIIPFPQIEFLGSYARKTLYPIKGDEFLGIKAAFPKCIISDSQVEGNYDFQKEYAVGNFQTAPFVDHYKAYFGFQKGLLEYQCETETNRNILIIGDSYARPLVPLIGSHYNQTFYVDLRQNEDFSISEFFKSYHADDVLIVSDYEVVFWDTEQWLITP